MLWIASFRAKATRLGPLPIDWVTEHMIVDHGSHLDSGVFEKVRGVLRLKSMQNSCRCGKMFFQKKKLLKGLKSRLEFPP